MVSIYQDLRGVNKLGDCPIEDVLRTIVNHPKKDEINSYRLAEKQVYDAYKAKSFLFTPHGAFNGKKADKNIKNLSGYFYIDIDNQPDTNALTVLKSRPEVKAMWRSFSGKGYGLIVLYHGIDENSFKEGYAYYANEVLKKIGIDADPSCSHLSRGCVISSDPDAFINEQTIPFEIAATDIKKVSYALNIGSKSSELQRSRGEEGYIQANDTFDTALTPSPESLLAPTKANWRTRLDSYGENGYVVFEDGHPFILTFYDGIVKAGVGQRNRTLAATFGGFVTNNPYMSLEKLVSYAHNFNRYFSIPLNAYEVEKIALAVITKFKKGHAVCTPKMKKIWFDPDDRSRSAREKQSISGQEMGKIRRLNRIKQLYDCCEQLNLDSKIITQKLLSATSGVSIITVKRYWPELKEAVELLNRSTTNNKEIEK